MHVISCYLFALALIVCVGCGPGGPTLAPVTGVITLDGKALADAEITFKPEQGRHSTSHTDGQGRYELQYKPDTMGAIVGRHHVKIFKFDVTTMKQLVPLKYNASSELTAEVEDRDNELNFDLVSD